jgi:hypothetical protein
LNFFLIRIKSSSKLYLRSIFQNYPLQLGNHLVNCRIPKIWNSLFQQKGSSLSVASLIEIRAMFMP